MPQIVYKDKNAVAIIKPVGMPSQSDPSGDKDAMSATSEKLALSGEESHLWLVHRLDRTVGGLLVFARTKTCAAELSASITDSSFKKQYYAVVEGEATGGEMRDFLFKDSQKSKAFVVNSERRGAKLAVLEYAAMASAKTATGTRTLVKIDLKTGRFHQIRAQFSKRGTPLVGDGKYGSRDKGARVPALFACSLSSPKLFGGTPVFARPDLSVYPWSLFGAEKYD